MFDEIAEDDATARAHAAREFGDDGRWARGVMQCQERTHTVDARVRERHRHEIGAHERDLSQSGGRDATVCFGQHFGRAIDTPQPARRGRQDR
jgi:hypothetical protein